MRHFFTPGRKGGRQLFTDPMTFAKDSMGFRRIVSKVVRGCDCCHLSWTKPSVAQRVSDLVSACPTVQGTIRGTYYTGDSTCTGQFPMLFQGVRIPQNDLGVWVMLRVDNLDVLGNPAAALCYDESRGISQIWTDDQPNYKNADLCDRMVLCLHTN